MKTLSWHHCLLFVDTHKCRRQGAGGRGLGAAASLLSLAEAHFIWEFFSERTIIFTEYSNRSYNHVDTPTFCVLSNFDSILTSFCFIFAYCLGAVINSFATATAVSSSILGSWTFTISYHFLVSISTWYIARWCWKPFTPTSIHFI